MSEPVILLSAGEPSGDVHGAELARELLARWPGARLLGLGGPRMQAQGVELLADPERLAVMGFAEVLRHLPFFVRLRRTIRNTLQREGVRLVIPIDYPGFNLRLARDAHRQGIAVLYYVAPQVWAWKPGRAREMARTVDRLAVILPFEESLLRREGVAASFVGHPLLEEEPEPPPRADFCRPLGLDEGRPVLALFPGSREQEIDRHLEPFTAAAEILKDRIEGLQPVLAAPGTRAMLRYHRSSYPVTTDSWALLAHARGAIVKSGTGTLQAALTRTPMVVAYRTNPATFWLARRLVRVDHVGLVNLVAGHRLVPELLQGRVSARTLSDALEPLLREGATRARAIAGLAGIRDALAAPGGGRTAARVAEIAGDLLDRTEDASA